MTENLTSVPMSDDTPLDQAVPSTSKYLRKEDVEPPLLVQIFNMTTDQVEGDTNAIENRAVLHFHGDIKPMILNSTNRELLKAITGANTVGGLRNQQVILYNDPTIIYKGKLTGGIRIRAATQPAPAQPTQPGTGPADFDDSIPY
jgi:hypothetical protein